MGRTGFISSLTGLRFVAAASVAVGHAAPSLRDDWLGFLVAQVSSVGMTLFFVLSGFVLWLNYSHSFRSQAFPAALRSFAVARFARLYPMYGVVVAGVTGYLLISRGLPFRSIGFILTMTQAWFPALGDTVLVAATPQLQHLWSISVELFFYLLFPALCLWLGRIVSISFAMLVMALNAAALSLGTYLCFAYGSDLLQIIAPRLINGAMQWLTYYAPYLHIFEFAAGVLSAIVYERLLAENRKLNVDAIFWLSTAGVALAPIFLFLKPQFEGNLLLIEVAVRLDEILAFSGLIIATSLGAARLLGSRIMVLGGECSYSIYLLHPFVFRMILIGKPEFANGIEFSVRLIAFVVAAAAIARASYIVIEAPARSWIRRELLDVNGKESIAPAKLSA